MKRFLILMLLCATAYATTPIAYYKMEETTGTSLTDSAGSNTGTSDNAVATILGKVGRGLSMVGASSDRIAISDAADFNFGASMSLSFWFKKSSDAAANAYLAAQYDSGLDKRAWWFYYWAADDTLRFRATDNAADAGQVLAVAETWDKSIWHHYAVTYNAGAAIIYIDGQVVGSGSLAPETTIANTDNDITIGCNENNGAVNGGATGHFDEVRFYAVVLTASEVKSLYGTRWRSRWLNRFFRR